MSLRSQISQRRRIGSEFGNVANNAWETAMVKSALFGFVDLTRNARRGLPRIDSIINTIDNELRTDSLRTVQFAR